MQVVEAIQNVLCPDDHLVLSDWLVLDQDSARQVVAPIASVFHVDLVQLVRLRVVVRSNDVRMIQLHMNRTLSFSVDLGFT